MVCQRDVRPGRGSVCDRILRVQLSRFLKRRERPPRTLSSILRQLVPPLEVGRLSRGIGLLRMI